MKTIKKQGEEIESKQYHEKKIDEWIKNYNGLCKLNTKQTNALSKEEQVELKDLQEKQSSLDHSDFMFSKGFIFGSEERTKEICQIIEELTIQLAYNILMDYFDCIPEEEREEVSDKLDKLGL